MKRKGKVPKSWFLVTAYGLALYPSIPHKGVNLALRDKLEEQNSSKIHTDNLANLTEFVLENFFFEFSKEVKQQTSGTVVGSKFASPYVGTHMDKTKTDFLS